MVLLHHRRHCLPHLFYWQRSKSLLHSEGAETPHLFYCQKPIQVFLHHREAFTPSLVLIDKYKKPLVGGIDSLNCSYWSSYLNNLTDHCCIVGDSLTWFFLTKLCSDWGLITYCLSRAMLGGIASLPIVPIWYCTFLFFFLKSQWIALDVLAFSLFSTITVSCMGYARFSGQVRHSRTKLHKACVSQ